MGSCPTHFWKEASLAPYMLDHPIASHPDQWALHVPLGFHGDSAKFNKQDSLMCLAWSSVLARAKDPFDNRWLICAVPTPWLLPGTLLQVSEVVAWSFCALADGTYPLTDHKGMPWPRGSERARLAGQSLAGGMKGTAVDLRGDWQFQSLFWGIPAHNGITMCGHCAARQTGPMAWGNFGPSAPWRSHPQTTAEYLCKRLAGSLNPMCLCPGWRLEFIRWDETHLVKLGVARFSIASALLDLSHRGIFDDGRDSAMPSESGACPANPGFAPAASAGSAGESGACPANPGFAPAASAGSGACPANPGFAPADDVEVPNLDWRLKLAWRDFRRWCLQRRVQCNARRFAQARLGVRTTYFPESC